MVFGALGYYGCIKLLARRASCIHFQDCTDVGQTIKSIWAVMVVFASSELSITGRSAFVDV
jgi:hypothetical protein